MPKTTIINKTQDKRIYRKKIDKGTEIIGDAAEIKIDVCGENGSSYKWMEIGTWDSSKYVIFFLCHRYEV